MLGRKCLGLAPAILAQHEMTNARLAGKFARIFQPVIEPAQQNRVRIEQRLRAKIRSANAIAPGNVLPRSGNQILMRARQSRCPLVARSARKPSMLPLAKHVIPAGNMQRRNANVRQALRLTSSAVQYSPG